MTTLADDPRIAAHLTAVATALATNPEVNAAAVLDHLRGHIAEALQSHASSPDPVATVLAELDPPEAYRATVASVTASGKRLGWWAFVISLAGPLIGVISGIIVTSAGGKSEIGWLIFTAIELAAFAAGLVGWRQPWGRVAVACAVGQYVLLLLLAA